MYGIQKIFLAIILSCSFLAQAAQKKTLVLDGPPIAGMFVTFNYVLGALIRYEKGEFSGVKVDFRDHGLHYEEERGPNWWNYYFEPIEVGKIDYDNLAQLSNDEINHLPRIGLKEISRMEANRLIKKYIKIKPHIEKKVQEFMRAHFSQSYVIGIHYRGNDKYKEIMRTPYIKVEQTIKKALEKVRGRRVRLFVASDEARFIDYVRQKFPRKEVIAINAIRSLDRKPIHFRDTDRYRVGEEALIDCLLLSRCHLLIRTPSSLSATSEEFSPHLPVMRAGNWR